MCVDKKGRAFRRVFRGRHSVVYVSGDKAIKIFKEELSYNFWKEVAFLSYLQPLNFVPKIYSICPDNLSITMKYIDGENLGKLIEKRNVDTEMLIKCLDICRTLDRLMIQKEEMNMPEKHIIFKKSKPYFIDFERGTITPKPANVSQFTAYIMRKLKINFKEIEDLAKNYKSKFDDESYEKLKLNLTRIIEDWTKKSKKQRR